MRPAPTPPAQLPRAPAAGTGRAGSRVQRSLDSLRSHLLVAHRSHPLGRLHPEPRDHGSCGSRFLQQVTRTRGGRRKPRLPTLRLSRSAGATGSPPCPVAEQETSPAPILAEIPKRRTGLEPATSSLGSLRSTN